MNTGETIFWRTYVYTALVIGGVGLLAVGITSNRCQETTWENRALKQDIKEMQVQMSVLEYDLNRMHHE